MNRSESIASLAQALSKAQAAIQPALKDKVNPAFRSHYATLESIVDACREPLAKNDLAVVQSPVDADTPDRVALETLIMHKSGEWISSRVSCRLAKPDAQGVGSALTYLRRYALAGMVGVTATEDDDGNAASTGSAPARAVVTKAQTADKPAAKPATKPTDDDFVLTAVGSIKMCKSTDSVSAAGKPYTRTEIGWLEADGSKAKGSTFSKTLAAQGTEALESGQTMRIRYKRGERGVDILSLEPHETAVEAAGGANALSF